METQRSSLDHFDRLVPYRVGQYLEIDESTRRSLEITRTMRDGRREGSLLAVIDRTTTAMGSRLLAEWVAAPLTERDAIEARLDAVEELIRRATSAQRTLRESLKGHLRPRTAAGPRGHRTRQPARSELHRPHAGEPAAHQGAAGRCRPATSCRQLDAALDPCPDLRAQLEAALVDAVPPVAQRRRDHSAGFHEQLD